MTNYIIDIVIILVFLFFGIRYLKTKDFDDKRDIYTEESKKKASLVAGIMFIIAAAYQGVLLVMKLKGISFGQDLVASLIPTGILLVILIVMLVLIYAVILKKK